MKNQITEILGSAYPIIQGAMRLITLGEMAAAVSRAGAFGIIAVSGLEGHKLRQEIRKARSLSDKPFGVNIPVYRPNALEALEIAIEEDIKTITTSAGDPNKIIKRVKEANLKILHVVSTVDMAKKAESAGVDAVIAIGREGGGHVGREEISTLVLIPQVVDAIKIPVVAAGGIADGRGLVAAFALGAQGIQMGTRFLATKECSISAVYKQALIEAKDTGTMVAAEKGLPLRVLKNRAALVVRKMEENGASPQEINAFVDSLYGQVADEKEDRFMSAGQIAGLIKNIMTVEELINNIIKEAKAIAQNLAQKF